MLYTLPDEIILLVAQLLSIADARRLRRVSHRLFAIVAITRPKPVILSFLSGTPEDVIEARLDLLVRNKAAPSPRAILINMSDSAWERRLDFDRPDPGPITLQTDELEFLSLSVSSTRKGVRDATILMNSMLFTTTFQSLTHLELVGLYSPQFPFANFPALVDLSLYSYFRETGHFPSYAEYSMHSILNSLAKHSLVSFTVSAFHPSPEFAWRLIQRWPKLRRLNLWPADAGPLMSAQTIDSTQAMKSFSQPINHQPIIENLCMNCIPVRPNTGPGSKVPLGAKRIGSYKSRYTVYDTDVVSASVLLADRLPSLQLIGWMVPIPNTAHCQRVWCRRQEEGDKMEWKCDTDDDCWPETDMDVVFS